MIAAETLRRLRLAGQRLAPATAAAAPSEAAAAACGIQAQDTRAAALALRARVPGLTRAQVDGAELVRTWTVRGTLHLLAADDLPWLHALCAPRFLARAERLLDKRGNFDIARAMVDDLLELVAEQPLERAEILRRLAERGHPGLGQSSVNMLMPWMALQGRVRGTAGGRWYAADPPPAVDEDEALATLGRRYLEGYGPATAADLASWSGLPIGNARRALEAAGPLEESGELVALPGAFDGEPPAPAPVKLLPAFDTTMLGYASREPLLAAEHDHRILPGGGMLRPVVVSRGRAVGAWRLTGSGGARRRLETTWFGRPAAARALAAEARDVGRFLGVEVQV